MRLASILLSAIMLTCLSIQVHALDEGDIAEPSIIGANMNMPVPLITKPNMETPATSPKPQIKQSNSPNQTLTDNTSIDLAQKQQEEGSDNISGKWSIKFKDRNDISLSLTLWSSSETKIMGFGTLTAEGRAGSVTANGSFAAQELMLSVKSAERESAGQKYDECDLDLFMENNTLSGTYILKLGEQSLGMGDALAVKNAIS
ncbi:Uncharacterised protein [uncultured archaeon]|nr:Uncharacterised protein [uncultured archaeon]